MDEAPNVGSEWAGISTTVFLHAGRGNSGVQKMDKWKVRGAPFNPSIYLFKALESRRQEEIQKLQMWSRALRHGKAWRVPGWITSLSIGQETTWNHNSLALCWRGGWAVLLQLPYYSPKSCWLFCPTLILSILSLTCHKSTTNFEPGLCSPKTVDFRPQGPPRKVLNLQIQKWFRRKVGELIGTFVFYRDLEVFEVV